MVNTLLRKMASWWDGIVGRDRSAQEHEQSMRAAWTLAAKDLGLVFEQGKSLCEDEIKGQIRGFGVTIQNQSDFDVQKLVTLICVFSKEEPPATQNLGREELLAAYDLA